MQCSVVFSFLQRACSTAAGRSYHDLDCELSGARHLEISYSRGLDINQGECRDTDHGIGLEATQKLEGFRHPGEGDFQPHSCFSQLCLFLKSTEIVSLFLFAGHQRLHQFDWNCKWINLLIFNVKKVESSWILHRASSALMSRDDLLGTTHHYPAGLTPPPTAHPQHSWPPSPHRADPPA